MRFPPMTSTKINICLYNMSNMMVIIRYGEHIQHDLGFRPCIQREFLPTLTKLLSQYVPKYCLSQKRRNFALRGALMALMTARLLSLSSACPTTLDSEPEYHFKFKN